MSSVWSIRRSTVDTKLTGFCGGVARYWGMDPVLVRVGAVLLALSGGIGIVLYVAAWLLIPADGAIELHHVRHGRRPPKLAARGVGRHRRHRLPDHLRHLQLHHHDRLRPGSRARADLVLRLLQDAGQEVGTSVDRRPTGQPTSLTPPPPAEPFRYPGPATPFTEAAEAWRQRVDDMRRSGTPGSTSVPTPPREPCRVRRPGPDPTPTWQTYPATAGPSTVQDPVSPELLGSSRPRRLPGRRRPGGALLRDRAIEGRRRTEPPDPGPLAVGPAAAPRVGGPARPGAARSGHRRCARGARSPR